MMRTKERKVLVLTKNTVIDGGLFCGNITCEGGVLYNLSVKGDIDALNINAGNINALNIKAWNINALNINAWNINARDINAWKISYYAVCFAYNNITCKSIEGTRENSKHLVLDGKIKVMKDKVNKK